MTRLPKAVREQVQKRAQGRCEYCHRPEAYTPYDYHVDHIISRKHRGSDELTNLAWACVRCNGNKGTDVGAFDPQDGVLTTLFNPRTQAWDDHFQLDEALIVGKTAIGRATALLLDMNHPAQVQTRTALIKTGLW